MKKTKDKTESGPTFYQTPNGKFLPSVYASALGRYYPYGGTFDMPRQQMYMPLDHVNAKGGYLAPILPMHFNKGTQIYRDTTEIPNYRQGGKLMDFPAASLSEREANINYNVYASMPGRYYSNGGQFLTAGGEYHRIYKNAEGDIMVNHPAEDKGKWDTINLTDKSGANTVAQGVAATKQWHIDNPNSYGNGGYTVQRSNDRKGKTHVVTGPDGTKKYFGDPTMGEKDNSENGKEAFYARHKHNLANNPYFRAYARATWENGGYIPSNNYASGGMIKRADGSYSQRGLWDNIRANKGSGKEPTKEMLAQERKIKSNQYGLGGHKAVFFATNVSEPGADDKDLTYPKDAYVYNNGGYVNPIKNSNLVNNFNSGGNMNFKSNAAYKAWLGYGHATGVFERTPGNQSVSIKGKSKNVEHDLGGYLMANGGGITPVGYPFNNPTFKAFGFAEGGLMGEEPIGPPKQYAPIDYATPSEDYIKNYKSNLEAYKNNPKTKEGVPMQGAEWSPISEEKRLTRLEQLKSLPANQINDTHLEEYYTLKNNKPFFTAGDSAFITAPVDFNKVQIPAKPQPTVMPTASVNTNTGFNGSYPQENFGWTAVQKAAQAELQAQQNVHNAEMEANKAFLANPVQKAEWEKYKANNPTDSITKFRSMYSSNIASNNTVIMPEGFAFGGSFNNKGFMSLPKEVQAKIKSNSFAEGGPITEFNEGGTHEENIMGGIPQGMGANGQPNLVEQGETKLDAENYIFSDRLKVTKDVAEDFNFPKNFVGKTFADVSKLMDRPNSRREHDTIEETAKKRDLQNLMEAQESFKEREVAKKMEEINSLDPTALQGMGQPQIPQSVEPMGMPEGMPIDPSQIPPEMLAQMPEAQQGAPVMACGGHMYRCGGKMYDFGGTVGTALKDYGLGIADETMSLVGLNNVIQDSAYSDSASGKFMKGYANVVGGIGQKVLPMAANMIAPGSGAIVSGVQQAAGQFNPGAEMTPEAKADMSKNYASMIPQAGGMYTPSNYAMGGSMYPGSETLGNMFLGGGPFEEEFTFDTNPSYRTNALKTPSLAELSEPNYYVQSLLPEQIREDVPEPTRTTTQTNIEVPEEVMTMFNKSPEEIALMSNEEKTALLSQYDSAIKKFNSKQDEKTVDLNFKQTPVQAAMQAAPALYNIGVGTGLWGKPEYYKASDYTTAADIKPYEYNIDPQVKEAQKTYAQYNNYLRNMGLDAGALSTNLGAAANGRNEALGRLYTEKLNADAQNAYAAKMANKQIEQSNKAIGLNVDSMNRALKAAKLNYLQTGLGQVADIGRNNQLTDLQLKHLGVLSPDYAGEAKYTSGWQSMFDAMKNRRNNSEEKIS